MNNEIISLSHNDLDGVGCQYSILEKYNNVLTFNIKYIDIQDYLIILRNSITNYTTKIFITDLAFKENDLLILKDLISYYKNIDFIYIDHHEYEEDSLTILYSFKDFSNFTLIHSIKKSASLLTKEYLQIKNKSLNQLIDYINAFDLWQENNKLFKVGWVLNAIFWDLKLKAFNYSIISNNFNIPKKFIARYKEILKEKNDYFKILENNGFVKKDYDTKFIFIFLDNFQSFTTFHYPDFKVYLLATSYNSISIRFRNIEIDKAKRLKAYIIDNISNHKGIISAGGHINAFGINIERDLPFEDFVEILEKIQKLIFKFIKSEEI